MLDAVAAVAVPNGENGTAHPSNTLPVEGMKMSASRFLAAAMVVALVPHAATFAADPAPATPGTITLAPDLLEIFNDPYPTGTYSIVALDPATGELGVGVQSNTIAVGARTRWGKGGVAAIASQAGSNPLYGDMGVFLLERGWTPKAALDFMTRGDANANGRQVAIIDIKGNTASWTSATNSDWKGHICGPNFCAQGNTLWGPDVVKNMGTAFEAAKGSLADRILAGLDAAEAAGGDRRGSMSAGLLILQPKAVQGFGDRALDLRVDFSDAPVQDLRKIYDADRAGSVGNIAAMVTAKDFDGALAAIAKSLAMDPNRDAAYVQMATVYMTMGKMDDAVKAMAKAIELNPKQYFQVLRTDSLAPVHTLPAYRALGDYAKFAPLAPSMPQGITTAMQ